MKRIKFYRLQIRSKIDLMLVFNTDHASTEDALIAADKWIKEGGGSVGTNEIINWEQQEVGYSPANYVVEVKELYRYEV